MHKLTLYHGSLEIIQTPIYGVGKPYNDYGTGFYCTRHLELAKEWACTGGQDGYANHYELDTSRLHILNLSNDDYTILHWLALLLEHRIVRTSTPMMSHGVQYIKETFHLPIENYDLITGYRADDSYFSFARAFVNNEISLEQLAEAMMLGQLGEQYVLKSKAAFESLSYIESIRADNTIYYTKRKKRDNDAREAYQKESEKEIFEGIYIRDLIQEGVKCDDPRLQHPIRR